MTVDEIMNYVLTSPNNTNPNILRPALEDLKPLDGTVYNITWLDYEGEPATPEALALEIGSDVPMPAVIAKGGVIPLLMAMEILGYQFSIVEGTGKIVEVADFMGEDGILEHLIAQLSDVTSDITIQLTDRT